MRHDKKGFLNSIATVCLFCVTFGGCSNAEREDAVKMRRDVLSELGQGYSDYALEHSVGPKGPQELVDFLATKDSESEVAKEAMKRLMDGDVIFFWNGKLDKQSSANETYLLGFEAVCPRTGGYVVMADGTVREVKAKAFSEMQEVPSE